MVLCSVSKAAQGMKELVSMKRSLARRLFPLLLIPSVSGCYAGYLLRGAYEQGKILAGREKITEILDNSAASPEEQRKLRLVLHARTFAQTIGLKPGESFTTFSRVDKDTLAWVVVGSKKDSFQLYTWWFPIVGTVPYKGFFDKADADEQAAWLEVNGYEASVRGTEAFSTLGWFNDPVLSTTLHNPPERIANTVIHESVHATVWIPNNVAFNESLANFVGSEGAAQYFDRGAKECQAPQGSSVASLQGVLDGYTCEEMQTLRASSRREADVQLELSTLVGSLYEALDTLYKDRALSSAEKIARREAVFTGILEPFRAKYPKFSALKKVHNAEIMQLKLYLTKLALFRAVFDACQQNWNAFFEVIRQVATRREESPEVDPFKELETELKKLQVVKGVS
jgi:predicted aminopeptidase